MLSNISIQKYIDSNDIIIRPWDQENMGAARITLHLGERVLIPDEETVVDVKAQVIPNYQNILLSENEPFLLHPGAFILSETYEEIGLSEKIGMLLEGRSTLARLGLSVVQTAMIIDTGQKPKKITLEIYNCSKNAILLYSKMKFCRACFFILEPPATIRYDTGGKYQSGDPIMPILRNEVKK